MNMIMIMKRHDSDSEAVFVLCCILPSMPIPFLFSSVFFTLPPLLSLFLSHTNYFTFHRGILPPLIESFHYASPPPPSSSHKPPLTGSINQTIKRNLHAYS